MVYRLSLFMLGVSSRETKPNGVDSFVQLRNMLFVVVSVSPFRCYYSTFARSTDWCGGLQVSSLVWMVVIQVCQHPFPTFSCGEELLDDFDVEFRVRQLFLNF